MEVDYEQREQDYRWNSSSCAPGGSSVISLPAEFCHLHCIKEGYDLPFVTDHIMKVIPMPEGKEDM